MFHDNQPGNELGLFYNSMAAKGIQKHYLLRRKLDKRTQQVIAPRAASQYAPANGSSTCGGSTSVRRRIHSPHISGGRPAAGYIANSLGSCATQPAGDILGQNRRTDGLRYRLMPPYGGGIKTVDWGTDRVRQKVVTRQQANSNVPTAMPLMIKLSLRPAVHQLAACNDTSQTNPPTQQPMQCTRQSQQRELHQVHNYASLHALIGKQQECYLSPNPLKFSQFVSGPQSTWSPISVKIQVKIDTR